MDVLSGAISTSIVSTTNYVERSVFSPPPKVKAPPPFNLELLVKQAKTRLEYAINANAVFHLEQMKKEYNKIQSKINFDYRFLGAGGTGGAAWIWKKNN